MWLMLDKQLSFDGFCSLLTFSYRHLLLDVNHLLYYHILYTSYFPYLQFFVETQIKLQLNILKSH